MKKWVSSIKNSRTKEQIDKSIKEQQKNLIKIIDRTVSWTRLNNESKSF